MLYYYYKVSYYYDMTDDVRSEEGIVCAGSFVEAAEHIKADYGDELEEVTLKICYTDGHCLLLDELKQFFKTPDSPAGAKDI